MKTRLAIYVLVLLLLPLAGLWLGGGGGSEATGSMAEMVNMPAVLLTTLLSAGYILFVNHLIRLLTGNSPLGLQRNYFLWVGAAGAILVWLLVYLNWFVASWPVQTENPVMQFLLYSPLFATLVPAVLVTRALLGTSGNLLKWLSRGPSLSAPGAETTVAILLPLAGLGLAGGVAWPDSLFWLLWIAPLLLLVAMQLLWGEGTIFSGLKSGDWGRVICAALAGVIVGNFVLLAYQYNGGITASILPGPLFGQLGFAAFGLLCLQLGDVIAEGWRGKQRAAPVRKKFPIPIVVRKN